MRHNHIIQRQSVEVEYQNISAGIELKDELGEVCKTRLMPAIGKLLNEYGEDHYLTIENLEIDAGVITFNNWQDEFVEQVVRELKEKLTGLQTIPSANNNSLIHREKLTQQNKVVHQPELNNHGGVNIHDKAKHRAQILLHFIKTGLLPWFAGNLKPEELKTTLDDVLDLSNQSANTSFITALKETLIGNPDAATRLVYQFTEEQVITILSQLSFHSTGFRLLQVWKILLSGLNISKQEQKKIIYSKAFAVAIKESAEQTCVENFCGHILSALTETEKTNLIHHLRDQAYITDLQVRLNQPEMIQQVLGTVESFDLQTRSHSKQLHDSAQPGRQRQNTHQQPDDAESFYVSNSGLVILHPFLPAFFENAGYLENRQWINEERQQRAIALTNFLLTGSEHLPEFDLLLNKIICGYPIDRPLPDFIELSDFEKAEAHDLLQSVINHWKALKNTSIDGLRSTFFLRDGKLNFNDGTWLLQVEQKTVDILLNKLPWGLSIIKLPWMREKLMVEWNS